MIKIKDKPVEKTIVEKLMPEFNSQIVQKAMIDLIFLRDEMGEWAQSPGDLEVQIRAVMDRSCFRIRFSLPVLLHFHRSLKGMNKMHVSHTNQHGRFPVGFFPTYNCNLNHLTLLRSHTKLQEWDDQYKASDDEDYFCKFIDTSKGEKMEQSSLNFILQNKSSSKNISDESSELINSCFENMYWRPPLPHFGYSPIHDFVYHSSSKIFDLQGVYKTIIKIVDIGKKRFELGRERAKYAHAEALVVFQNEGRLHSESKKLFILEPSASCLEPDDVANCILSKRLGQSALPAPIMIRGTLKKLTNFDLDQLLSLVIWKKQQELDGKTRICRVGHTDEVKDDVLALVEGNMDLFDDDKWVQHFERRFKDSLARLHPIILEDGGTIYHVPPPLVSYIIARKIPVLGSRNDLLNLLKFVDTIDPKTPFDKKGLRLSNEGEKVQNGPCRSEWGMLVKEIPRVANRIMYSRVFSKPSTM